MLANHQFPSKILLFGEYTILNGSKALAIPHESFFGEWSYEDTSSEACSASRTVLKSFLEHDSLKQLRMDLLVEDFAKGLWFKSSIPNGYGLGSSGALIAALFKQYGTSTGSLQGDKLILARLEDYFHGSSSGIDPLVSLIQKPLLIHHFDEVEPLEHNVNVDGFFLLNTGKPRNTGPLVSIYQEKLKDPEFKRGCAEVLSREVNYAIEELLKGQRQRLSHHLWLISKFQWEYFPEMIPTQMRGPWLKGLESGDYILKLCGAGGGGFIIGYSEKFKFSEIEQFSSVEVKDLL